MTQKKKWNWEDDECLRAMSTSLIGGNNTQETRDAMCDTYDGVPDATVFSARIRQARTTTIAALKRILGEDDYSIMLERLDAYSNVKKKESSGLKLREF